MASQFINIEENGIHMVIEITGEGETLLRHMAPFPYDGTLIEAVDDVKYRICEVQVAGMNQDDHHASRHTGTMPGRLLRYVSHSDTREKEGRRLSVALAGGGLHVTCHFQFYHDIPVVRSHTEVRNSSDRPLGLEYVTSFSLTGLTKEGKADWEETMGLSLCYNAWYSELQWREYRLPELGLAHTNWASTQRIEKHVTGTWPTSETMPMGFLKNRETGVGWLWQIESNGSWCFEIADLAKTLFLHLSGPSFQENQWFKSLAPGETFSTVPAAVAVTEGDLAMALGAMNCYRRANLARPASDSHLSVVFNDAICFDLDPTQEKVEQYLPLAAEAGCEGFCIDAGWYAKRDWWSEAGNWHENRERFPGGMRAMTDAIRARGMFPGLWLEPEVMGAPFHAHHGTGAPIPGQAQGSHEKVAEGGEGVSLAKTLPDSWFFTRHGHRVMDHGRYQLDLRNEEARAFMTEAMARCVEEYGADYMKIDYNINAGPGTDRESDSLGDGLLGHCRAYLQWLEDIQRAYPRLIVENCASGGQRMDFATMRRCALASITDQGDIYELARIAAAAPSAMPPEQCGMWVCPMPDFDEEQTALCFVNALLLRIHLSAPLPSLLPWQLLMIREAIGVYKDIRGSIAIGTPIWPLGLPRREDGWIAFGLQCEEKGEILLALWRLFGEADTITLEIPFGEEAQCLFPRNLPTEVSVKNGVVKVRLPQKGSARIISIQG